MEDDDGAVNSADWLVAGTLCHPVIPSAYIRPPRGGAGS